CRRRLVALLFGKPVRRADVRHRVGLLPHARRSMPRDLGPAVPDHARPPRAGAVGPRRPRNAPRRPGHAMGCLRHVEPAGAQPPLPLLSLTPAGAHPRRLRAGTAPVPGEESRGLGNSVPSGTACSCENLVSAYAAMVAAGTNAKATVDNAAI